MDYFKEKLETLAGKGRLRSLSSSSGIDLTSNDYLGMADHPALRQEAIAFLEEGGIGAAGSRLLRGHSEAHESLESMAAEFFGFESALYFASGFQANYSIFTTLPSRHDLIIYDEILHASARDGISASHAKSIKVRHNDLDGFEAALKKARGETKGKVWLAVEALYSMDGDFSSLKSLSELSIQYDSYLIVDEAHSGGVYGENGRGLAYNLPKDNVISLHTCGKAFGAAGGLVCSSKLIISYLINHARGFIYSTAPMPLQAHLVEKSIGIVGGEEGDQRRDQLFSICNYAREKLGGDGSPIVPILIGDDMRSVEIANAMQLAGYDIRAIRPPTVPEGTARLRLSLSSNLSEEILDGFFDALEPCLEQEKAA